MELEYDKWAKAQRCKLWSDENIPDNYKQIVNFCMFDIPDTIRKKYQKKFEKEDIGSVLEDYFHWRFHHAELKGCTIITTGTATRDDERLFSEMCGEWAEAIYSKYHFFPIEITIRKGREHHSYHEMTIEYFRSTN